MADEHPPMILKRGVIEMPRVGLTLYICGGTDKGDGRGMSVLCIEGTSLPYPLEIEFQHDGTFLGYGKYAPELTEIFLKQALSASRV